MTGTYSNGTKQPLAAAGESFISANTAVATVSAAGVVSIASDASIGASASIGATDNASGIMTAAASSTLITVIAPTSPPTASSIAAAQATVADNALCTSITPFYWEIGDQSGALVSGSEGTDSGGNPVLASTSLSIASASKWIYSTYVVQLRGGASSLSAQDVNFLHFTSGYTYMGSDTTSSECPSTDTPDTINTCLTLSAQEGVPYDTQNPATVGRFDYDSGHMENHASQFTSLGNVPVGSLGATISAALGSGISFVYTEPLLAGGIYTTTNQYTQVLRGILSGALGMLQALGTNPVCTRPSTSCNAAYSPIPESWHYSIGHWVEDDPSTNGDGAFSSPGAFGFYPWIESSRNYYGVIARQNSVGVGTPEQNGYKSAQCGRLLRRAFDTGVEQIGTIPSS